MHITHNIKHVALYVGHLYKPFWSKKIDRVGRGGQGRSGKVREGQNMAPEMDSNQLGGTFWGYTSCTSYTSGQPGVIRQSRVAEIL